MHHCMFNGILVVGTNHQYIVWHRASTKVMYDTQIIRPVDDHPDWRIGDTIDLSITKHDSDTYAEELEGINM